MRRLGGPTGAPRHWTLCPTRHPIGPRNQMHEHVRLAQGQRTVTGSVPESLRDRQEEKKSIKARARDWNLAKVTLQKLSTKDRIGLDKRRDPIKQDSLYPTLSGLSAVFDELAIPKTSIGEYKRACTPKGSEGEQDCYSKDLHGQRRPRSKPFDI